MSSSPLLVNTLRPNDTPIPETNTSNTLRLGKRLSLDIGEDALVILGMDSLITLFYHPAERIVEMKMSTDLFPGPAVVPGLVVRDSKPCSMMSRY